LNIVPQIHTQLLALKLSVAKKGAGYNKLALQMNGFPKIVSSDYFGGSSIEYALSYGILVSGKYGGLLSENLKMHYPMTYMHYFWSRSFYEGNKEIKPSSFIKPGVVYALYIGNYTADRLNAIVEDIQSDMPDYVTQPILVDRFPESAEALFHISFNRAEKVP
jgi:hypothetical protein